MRIGEEHSIAVGNFLVTKITDVKWYVLNPENDAARVDADPVGYGWLGEGWAVAAVEYAEQSHDRAEVEAQRTVLVSADELAEAYATLAGQCLAVELSHPPIVGDPDHIFG